MSETPPDPDMAAAELALGVLEGDERTAAERRRLADPAFAREVEAWEQRLARIAADEAPERAPPPRVWTAVAAALGKPEDRGGPLVVLRRRLAVWRGIAAGAGALAASLAVALVLRPAPAPVIVAAAPAPPPPVQAASLSSAKGGRVAFVAVFDPARQELVLTPASITGLPGRSPELWVIPAGGKPVSLGVAAFGRPVRLSVRALARGNAAGTLAVSVEPEGGSPTGQPTGPVIATGRLQAL